MSKGKKRSGARPGRPQPLRVTIGYIICGGLCYVFFIHMLLCCSFIHTFNLCAFFF